MPISAVQKSENYNRKNASYFKSAVLGAIVGYCLKHLIPITSQEKDEFYNAKVSEIKTKAQKARLEEIHLLAEKAKPEIESIDKFINICNKYDSSPAETNAKIKLTGNTMNLIYKVNNLGREITQQGMKSLTATIKRMRPTSSFVIAGTAIGLTTALIRNISNRVVEEKAETET